MLLYLRNTLLYATLATAFMLLSSIPAAYALSRLQWKGRNVAFVVVLMMMMLPPQVTQVPIYVMWTRLHLTGTLWPMILPNLLGDAFSIFLLRQFFLTIPQEYADAARVDGCSEWRVMTKVILPMAKPGIAATAMFMFFFCWNDFYGPTLYTSENPDSWTISLGLASFRNLYQVQWNLTMAATILAMLPVLIVFFLAQKVFVEGITLTGVKG
jgi:multiple sugar transport system permease protein